MASNNFKYAQWIAREGLSHLRANLAWPSCGNSMYQAEFDNAVYAKGDQIQIRRSNRRLGGEGSEVNYDDINERTEYMKIEKQFHDAIEFGSREQTLFTTGKPGLKNYFDNYIAPSINRITTQINQYMGEKAAKDLIYTYGTPGTPLNSPAMLANVYAMMQDLTMPVMDDGSDTSLPYLMVNPTDGAALKSSMVNYFNKTFNVGIGERFFLEKVMSFIYHSTQTTYQHTPGLASAMAGLTVKVDVTSGSTITITGATPSTVGAIKAGDVIYVDGSYLIAAQTYNVLPYKATFVATADADSDVAGDIVVTVKDEIILLGSGNANANLDAKLAAGATVTVLAAAVGKTSYNVNAAFTKPALSYAMPKMQMLSGFDSYQQTDTVNNTGIVLRVTNYADGKYDKNYMRLDVLCGARFFPEYGLKIIT